MGAADAGNMSVEDPTAAELLTEVNKAIRALLMRRVSSYTVGGVSYRYEDLNNLRLLRRELAGEAEIAAGTRGGILHADISRRDA